MVEALEPTRENAQALYLQGFLAGQISSKIGVKTTTINTWIHRYGWNDLKAKVATHLEKSVTTPLVSNAVASASARVREAFSGTLVDLADKVAASKPKSLKQAIALQEALEPAYRNSERAFAWSQSTSTTAFSALTLSEVDSPAEPQAIDTVTKPAP